MTWCASWATPTDTVCAGLTHLRGLPFLVGRHSEKGTTYLVFGEGAADGPVEIKIDRPARWIIFAHRLLESHIDEGEPGVGMAAAKWLSQKKIVLLGSDNWAIEAVPHEDPERPCQMHQFTLTRNGIYHLENLNLSELAADGLSEFAFIFAPLRLKGATGSPGWVRLVAGSSGTFEDSLNRLGIGRIDILLIHDVDRRNQGERQPADHKDPGQKGQPPERKQEGTGDPQNGMPPQDGNPKDERTAQVDQELQKADEEKNPGGAKSGVLIRDLRPKVPFYFWVTYRDAAGKWSKPSAAMTATLVDTFGEK